MKTQLDELEEMLELGRWMGCGERYLMLYEGQLAITNRVGLARWPKGRRQMIAVLSAADCACALTSRQRGKIFERLRTLKNCPDPNWSEQAEPWHVCRNSAGRTPPPRPT